MGIFIYIYIYIYNKHSTHTYIMITTFILDAINRDYHLTAINNIMYNNICLLRPIWFELDFEIHFLMRTTYMNECQQRKHWVLKTLKKIQPCDRSTCIRDSALVSTLNLC